MFERIYWMLIKEFIQIFRDPRMKILIFISPIIQTLIFGYAVTTDVRNIRTVIYDQDNSPASRRVIQSILYSGYFTYSGAISNTSELNQVMNDGTAQLVLHFAHGFAGNLGKGEPAPLQVIVDGTDGNTAGIIQSYVGKILTPLSPILHKEYGPPLTTILGSPLILESRSWFNQDLESRNYYVPGIIATLLSLVTLTLTSMAIVREKEVGTMEQLLVSPITKIEFILGKTIPFIIIGFIDVLLIIFVATYWFEIPIKGNVFLLLCGASLYLLTTLGIGLLASTISQTQQQALFSVFLLYFPMLLLSGFIFPVANMPEVIRWLTVINPLKYFAGTR